MQWNWHAGAIYIYNEWDIVSSSIYWRSNRNALFSWQQYLVASFSKKWLGGSPWRELSLSVLVRHITKWAVASVSDVWVTLLSHPTLLPPYLRRLSHTPSSKATALGQFQWNDWCAVHCTALGNIMGVETFVATFLNKDYNVKPCEEKSEHCQCRILKKDTL